jgi:glutamine amidotransferase
VGTVIVVDYGMGNLQSVARKLQRIGARPLVTSDPETVCRADRLVLPGVGHFKQAMDNLRSLGLQQALDDAVLRRETPILGICLGMQLFANRSEEGNVAGLGWIDADVVRFRIADTLRYKVPHMGWNGVHVAKRTPLTQSIDDSASFYFVHSYHLLCRDPQDVLCETCYEYVFASAVQTRNITGVQFHPEKSHDAGEQLLRNFVAS